MARPPKGVDPKTLSREELLALHKARKRDGEKTIFAVALTVIILSVVMSTDEQAVVLFGYTLPPLCVWKGLFGTDCLGCGLTRSFVLMGHAEVVASFHQHYLGPPLWLATLAQLFLRGRAFLDPGREAEKKEQGNAG